MRDIIKAVPVKGSDCRYMQKAIDIDNLEDWINTTQDTLSMMTEEITSMRERLGALENRGEEHEVFSSAKLSFIIGTLKSCRLNLVDDLRKFDDTSLDYATLIRIISDIDMALDFVIEASHEMLVHYKDKGVHYEISNDKE